MKQSTMWLIVTLSTIAAVLVLTVGIVGRVEHRGQHGWCGHRWHHATLSMMRSTN